MVVLTGDPKHTQDTYQHPTRRTSSVFSNSREGGCWYSCIQSIHYRYYKRYCNPSSKQKHLKKLGLIWLQTMTHLDRLPLGLSAAFLGAPGYEPRPASHGPRLPGAAPEAPACRGRGGRPRKPPKGSDEVKRCGFKAGLYFGRFFGTTSHNYFRLGQDRGHYTC